MDKIPKLDVDHSKITENERKKQVFISVMFFWESALFRSLSLPSPSSAPVHAVHQPRLFSEQPNLSIIKISGTNFVTALKEKYQ